MLTRRIVLPTQVLNQGGGTSAGPGYWLFLLASSALAHHLIQVCIGLRASYAQPGTDLAHGTTRSRSRRRKPR
eukprot:3697156-Rhodomonas_salina.6